MCLIGCELSSTCILSHAREMGSPVKTVSRALRRMAMSTLKLEQTKLNTKRGGSLPLLPVPLHCPLAIEFAKTLCRWSNLRRPFADGSRQYVIFYFPLCIDYTIQYNRILTIHQGYPQWVHTEYTSVSDQCPLTDRVFLCKSTRHFPYGERTTKNVLEYNIILFASCTRSPCKIQGTN